MSSKSRLNVEFARNETGQRETADAYIQSELDTTQVGTGVEAGGGYSANGSTTYINAATSLKDADIKLDTNLKSLADSVASFGSGSFPVLQSELDTTQSNAGLATDGTYTADATTFYTKTATNLKEADKFIDAQVKVVTDGLATELTTRENADTAIQAELDATQAGAGLGTGGAYNANVAADFISLATSLSDADNKLDAAVTSEVANRISADTAIQVELDASQVGAGLATNGTYAANTNANYIDSAVSLKDADNTLDSELKTLSDTVTSLSSGTVGALQTEVNNIEAAGGLDTDGTYIVNGTANYINGATSLANADDLLDAQAKTNATGLATEITDRTTAVSSEASVRSAADDAIEAGAGLEANGTYAAETNTNYITNATSLKDADEKLDAAVKVNQTSIDNETTARVSADTTINNSLTAESNTRSTTDAAIQAELDAAEAGAGLHNDGSYIVNSNATYIAVASDLAGADDLLDAQVKVNADAITTLTNAAAGDVAAVQAELDVTQTGAGLNADGTYTANGSSNFVTTSLSLKDADNDLDSAIKAEETARIANDTTQQTEIDDTQVGAGLNADGTYTADASTTYITGATSLANADKVLDVAIKANADKDTAQDLVIAAKLALAGGTMSGNINMDSNGITGLPAPTNASDAANKGYVDANLAGLSWKNAVLVASTGNIDIATGGVAMTIDGVSVSTGDRVLLMNQTAPAENGVYDAASGAWDRSTDFDSLTPIDEINGAAVYVETGSTYADNGYTVSSQVVTLDTDPIVFTQFNGASGITAGTGLVKIGNTLDINLGAGIGELPSDEIGVEVYPAGGLFNTIDGSTETTNTAAQLSIKLDGSTITRGASGIKVSDATINSIATNAADIVTEATNRGAADDVIQAELDATQAGAGLGVDGTYTPDSGADYIASATSLLNADSLLDDQIKTNTDAITALAGTAAGDVATVQAELDVTQLGAGLGTGGEYTANAATNYLKLVTSLKTADEALDTQLKYATDTADAAEPDLGVGIDEGYVLITSMAGVRSWVPFNQTQVGRIQETFTATAAQSEFTVNYDPNIVDVYLNGFKLVKGSDFTGSNGTSITVSPALAAGDILEVVSYEQYIYANIPQYDASGDLWITGDVHATAFYTDSLRALKTNIEEVEFSALDMVNETEVVSFNYKTDLTGDKRIGFIADDTDVVMSSSSKNQFDIPNTIGVLLKAVQELSAEVADLKDQLGD